MLVLAPALAASNDHILAIRLDDWMLHGDDILVAMLQSGTRVYPTEQATSMLLLLQRPPSAFSQFEKVIYNQRRWYHWALSALGPSGIIHGDLPLLSAVQDVFVPILAKRTWRLRSFKDSHMIRAVVYPPAVHPTLRQCMVIASSVEAATAAGDEGLMCSQLPSDLAALVVLVEMKDFSGNLTEIMLHNWKAAVSDGLLVVALLAPSFQVLASWTGLVAAVGLMDKHADAVVFATHAEAPEVC